MLVLGRIALTNLEIILKSRDNTLPTKVYIIKAIDSPILMYIFESSDQFSCSVVSDSLQRYGLQHARLSCPSPTPGACSVLMTVKLVMASSHLILCHSLLLPSVFPSIRVFSKESILRIRWPEYWSLSFNISPSNEHSGLISFRMD